MNKIGFLIAALFIVLENTHAAPFRVVIDPGHGGADHGTVFDNGTTYLAEKDVTLALALETSRQLRERGFYVVLTREGDQDVALPARTALANRIGADVFLSIHMNSTPDSQARDAEGSETFILNNASDASSKRLAQLENSVIGTTASDSPEQMDVALILKDLRLDANLTESKRLACGIQQNLIQATSGLRSSLAHPKNRGVKQALFHVLLGADMPSALVEAGFLTSARDRAIVLSPHGREALAQALGQAFEQFRKNKGTSKTQLELSTCKVN
jgi:N-acetylmuramoyl-L-alanine amidase